MLVFPSNPNTGDVFAPGPGFPSWMWDGDKWTRAAAAAFTLEGLEDVMVDAPVQGEMLAWDAAAERWVNTPVPAPDLSSYATQQYVADQIAAIPAPPTPTLAGLADTSLANLAAGQALAYTGSAWVNSNTFGSVNINGDAPSTALNITPASGRTAVDIWRPDTGTFVYGRDTGNSQQFVIEDIAGFVRFNASNVASGLILACQGISSIVIDPSGTVRVNPYGQAVGTALDIFSSAGSWGAVMTSTGAGHGLYVRGGGDSNTYCALFRNQASDTNYLRIMGDGSGSIGPNNSTFLSWDTAGNFRLNGNATFGSVSKAQNGYEISPNGVVRQWGLMTNSAAGMYQISFPIAFPNACVNVVAIPFAPQNTSQILTTHGYSTTGFGVYQIVSGSILWQAVGY